MSGFFYNLGRPVGAQGHPRHSQIQWIYDGLTGTEEEALRAEVALGRELARELRETLQPVQDDELAGLTGETLRRLAQRLRNPRRAFALELFHDPVPNAMALPGGFLFLSDSLAEFCGRDPEELAFVIGHEMAHVIRNHARDRMINEAALRAASTVTSRLGPLGGWLRREGIALLRSAHANKSEFEADDFAYRLAAAAGCSNGGISFLQRVGRKLAHGPLGYYLESHPPPAQRIARLTRLSQELGRD